MTSCKVMSAIDLKHAREAKRRGVPLEGYLQALAILDKSHADDEGSHGRPWSHRFYDKKDFGQAFCDNLNLNVRLEEMGLIPPPP